MVNKAWIWLANSPQILSLFSVVHIMYTSYNGIFYYYARYTEPEL